MNLTGKTFRAIANSRHGALNTDTRMTFLSEAGSHITGVYSGGTITTGTVVARRTSDSTIAMLYQCITTAGELKAGQASARFSRGAEQRTCMHLDWQWLTDDRAKGVSEWLLDEGS